MFAFTGVCRKGLDVNKIENIKDGNEREKYGIIFETWLPFNLDSLRFELGLQRTNKRTMTTKEGKQLATILQNDTKLIYNKTTKDNPFATGKDEKEILCFLEKCNKEYKGEHIFIFDRAIIKNNLIELLNNAPIIEIKG